MSNIVLLTEAAVIPLLQPKRQDLIQLIGEDNMKRETSFAIQAVNSNSYLMQATTQSVAKAIWNVAITGLTLNPIHKLAYLVPKRIGDNVEAILTPSYQGLVKLLTDTKSVTMAYAHCVYKGDEFEVILGNEYTLSHKPRFASKEVTHVYAVGLIHDGTKQFEVMSVEQVNEIRDRSDGYKAYQSGKAKSAIWVSDYDEMARKTVLKRLCKYLPKSNEWEKVNTAIEIDNQEYPATMGQEGYITNLLQSSTYDHERRYSIEKQVLAGVSSGEAEKIITDLQNNQLNPVQAGLPYNMTDAKNAVAEKLAD
jgi:phage RecT family recombinase